MLTEARHCRATFTIRGTHVDVAALRREGSSTPIVFLHGFGSTKEDYADVVRYAALEEHGILAYDAPGCGQTSCSDLSKISIPFLVDTAKAMLERYAIDQFHLVGHSMGGLTALMLAHELPKRVLSFVDIEGNVAPEDCFLSRQIVEHADPNPDAFFDRFIARTHASRAYASALYASSLRHKVRAGAVRGIFSSMVELSDHGDLMTKFLGLPCPKMFMYGEDNADLTYLPSIERNGVRLAEIPNCGHFPMYSNPVRMWSAIADFLPRTDVKD